MEVEIYVQLSWFWLVSLIWLVATKVIEAGEEVFVDYNYDVDSLNSSHWQWFSDAYKQHQRSRTMELTDNLINIEL